MLLRAVAGVTSRGLLCLSVQYVEIIGQDLPLNAIDRYNKFISAAATGNLTLR